MKNCETGYFTLQQFHFQVVIKSYYFAQVKYLSLGIRLVHLFPLQIYLLSFFLNTCGEKSSTTENQQNYLSLPGDFCISCFRKN